VIISEPHPSQDVVIVPLTSKVTNRQEGEFILQKWSESGLNVPTAVKRGFYTIQKSLILKVIGQLEGEDAQQLETSIRYWLGL
jgi:mRNA interferase MazF